jgi:hypothetical protein
MIGASDRNCESGNADSGDSVVFITIAPAHRARQRTLEHGALGVQRGVGLEISLRKRALPTRDDVQHLFAIHK